VPDVGPLQAVAGGALVELSSGEVADDWAERWRAFHRAVTVGGRLHVRPPWAPPAPAGHVDVVIDPGQAFGTGAHATTRLCLELLLGVEPGGALVDVGCGSGVLAIAAAKLGWAPVLGLDHDPLALDATSANAAANGVDVEVRRHDLLRDGPPPAAPAMLANLLGPLLRRMAADWPRAPRPPGMLIAGGLLARAADEIAGAFARRGLRERARRAEGDWAALLLAR
jgi:ribosomal protein L11 methyltransferase